jgi:hypothetical protein
MIFPHLSRIDSCRRLLSELTAPALHEAQYHRNISLAIHSTYDKDVSCVHYGTFLNCARWGKEATFTHTLNLAILAKLIQA